MIQPMRASAVYTMPCVTLSDDGGATPVAATSKRRASHVSTRTTCRRNRRGAPLVWLAVMKKRALFVLSRTLKLPNAKPS